MERESAAENVRIATITGILGAAVTGFGFYLWAVSQPADGSWFQSVGAMIVALPLGVLAGAVLFAGTLLIRWILQRSGGEDN